MVRAAEHPGGEDDVGLVDVEGVGLDGGEQFAERPGHLAAGDAHAGRRRAQSGQTAQVRAGERLLEPQDVVLGELDGDRPRRDRVDRRRRVAGHPPALVEVDHDRHRIADRVPGRGDGGQALLEPSGIDPDLERARTPPRAGAAPIRRAPPAAAASRTRRRPGCPSVAPPKSVATGQPGDLADDVPQRDLERPVAAGVEVDRLEDADVTGDRQRIAADEQVLEGLEAVHRVARSDADDALVGLDPDDRRRERAARDRVPGGRERRVERQDETVQSDAGDTHVGSIAQSPLARWRPYVASRVR